MRRVTYSTLWSCGVGAKRVVIPRKPSSSVRLLGPADGSDGAGSGISQDRSWHSASSSWRGTLRKQTVAVCERPWISLANDRAAGPAESSRSARKDSSLCRSQSRGTPRTRKVRTLFGGWWLPVGDGFGHGRHHPAPIVKRTASSV
jgi:hypothetical protein